MCEFRCEIMACISQLLSFCDINRITPVQELIDIGEGRGGLRMPFKSEGAQASGTRTTSYLGGCGSMLPNALEVMYTLVCFH